MTLSKIVRKCVGCNQLKGCDELFRVCIIDGSPVVDASHSLQSRAGYVCRNAECISKARKTRGLNRSLKKNIDDSIYDTLLSEVQ